MAQNSAASSGTFPSDSDIHVTYEDQQKINKFARQNARLEDVMEELKIKEPNSTTALLTLLDSLRLLCLLISSLCFVNFVRNLEECQETFLDLYRKNNLENLKYAEDELLPGEDSIPVKFGEVFVALDYDETEQTIGNAKGSVKTEIESLKQQCERIRTNMNELKVQLYTKFGTSINLEPDDS